MINNVVLQLPSGKVLTQSTAIARYAAKLGGLYPENPELALEVDEIVDIVASDILASAPQHADAEEKKKLREAWAEGKLKVSMSYLNEKAVAAKGSFLVDGKRSIADLYVYSCIRGFQNGSYDYVSRDYVNSWSSLIDFVKLFESDTVYGAFKIPNK